MAFARQMCIFVELHRHIEVSQSGIVIHLGNTVIALYQFVTQLKAFFVFSLIKQNCAFSEKI